MRAVSGRDRYGHAEIQDSAIDEQAAKRAVDAVLNADRHGAAFHRAPTPGIMRSWPNAADVFRHLPFPFEGGVFPANLGAVVQSTVLVGQEPAREVIRAVDGSWAVGDGVNDPNVPGASVVTHIAHVIERRSGTRSTDSKPRPDGSANSPNR